MPCIQMIRFNIVFRAAIFSFMLFSKAFAQHFEIGAMAGGSNYFGDLAASPVLTETKPAYGVFARVNMSSSFAITASLTNATISGDDKNFAHNAIRNINFNTPIFEYAGWVEFNFFKFGVDVQDKRYTPYVFLGAAITQYDPSAVASTGQTVKLRNLRTEDIQYGTYTVSIPWGVGFKWQFHKHFAMDWNLGFRYSMSDYLDDVSTVYPDFRDMQKRKGDLAAELSDPSRAANFGLPLNQKGYRRGNADYSDWYIVSTVSLSYRFYKHLKCRRFY